MKFHEFFILRRLKLNLDQYALARQVHISDECLHWIENGRQIPTEASILCNLADALHLDRNWFQQFAMLKAQLFTNCLSSRGRASEPGQASSRQAYTG